MKRCLSRIFAQSHRTSSGISYYPGQGHTLRGYRQPRQIRLMASEDFFPMLAGFGCDMNFRNMGSLSRLGTTIDRSASPPTHGWLGVLSIHVADFAVSAPRDSSGSECATDAVSRRGPAARFRDGIIQLCSSCWCGYSSRSATGRASRIVPHTRIFSAKWRFTALEERPGRSCSICAHRFPRFLPEQSERAHTHV